MDSKYRPNGRLIDIVDDEWRAEDLPHEDIQVPLEELPDPEADTADSHLTLKEQSMRWQENFPETEKINVREQLPKYLNDQVKLLTTRCIIIETEKVAKKTHGALTILKQFGIHECGHKEAVVGPKCILEMVSKTNEKHYITATQDRDLQEKLRKRAGAPILYLHNKSPTLEKPSKASYDKVNPEGTNSTFITETQNEILKKMKKALGVEEVQDIKVLNKRRKPHNPNPLSCKKKKNKHGAKGGKAELKKSEGKVKKHKKKNKSKLKGQLVTTLSGQ